MKNIAFLFFTLLVILSCKKESTNSNNSSNNTTTGIQKGISYPDSVYYGKNILSYPDSSIFIDGANYEIGAVLEKDASLYVVLNNYPVTDTTSGHQTEWFYADETGWAVDNYNSTTNSQKFIAIQNGRINAQIFFSAYGRTGKCRIDFYENGNTVTRTKHFFWH